MNQAPSVFNGDPHSSGLGYSKGYVNGVDGLADGTRAAPASQQLDPNMSGSGSYPTPLYHNLHSNGTASSGTGAGPGTPSNASHPPLSSLGGKTSSSAGGYSGYSGPPASAWSSSVGQVPPNSMQQGFVSGSSNLPLPAASQGGYLSSSSSGLPGGSTYPGNGVVSSSMGTTSLPMPQQLSSSVSSGVPGGPNAGPASYPYMSPMHHPVPQAPMSAPGGLGGVVHGGLGPYGQQQAPALPAAGPQAATLAAAALKQVQPHGYLGVQGVAALVTRPQLGDDLYCSCPMVCVVGTNHGAPHAVPLNIMNLQFEVHCHISQAFVTMQLVCHYPMSWNDAPLVFFLPKTTDTTITELCIENMVRPSVFATAVVPLDDMKKFGGNKGAAPAGPTMGPAGESDEAAGQDPEMFMLPLPPGLPGDQYRVKLSYFHPMTFDLQQGRYVLRLPTTVPQVCLAQGSSVNSVLDVTVTVNTGAPEEVDLLVPSHPISITESQLGSMAFQLDTNQVWENGDFVAGYRVWRDQMTATVHVEAPQPGMPDQRGTFALSITPPGPENSVRFPRSVVFMFDRSGSMTGDPIRFAKAALLTGLHMLGPEDKFTVVAFDHEQLWWTDRLIEATPENILTCMHWVNDDLTARGTTDINAPMQRALKLLGNSTGLPFVFLLTDGCVDDERDICLMAEAVMQNGVTDPNNITITTDGGTVTAVNPQPAAPPPSGVTAPRIYTFGIGPYCNHYFLKRLAAIGRGMNEVAFRPHAIQAVMERMLAAAALPMLSDVQISVQGLTQVELYPFPIPDVFVGQPLLVSGKFEGDWPETVEICGTLPDGSSWTQTVPTMPAGELPLQKVFTKSQLDLMTAHAWMRGNPPNLVQQIVDLSMASGVTSAHTAMVGFETTPERYEQMQGVPANERRKKLIKWAIGGAAGIGIVAGVAAALTFGDLAATMGNIPVGDAMAGMGDLGGFFESLGDAMDCCGGGCDCCGDCGDCGDICGACLTC